MNSKKNRLVIYIALNAILLVVILCLALNAGKGKKTATLPEGTPSSTVTKLYADEEVKAEVVINTKVIEDGLRDMGLLISQE